MYKPKFLILKIKSSIIPLLICLFIFLLLFFSSNNIIACKNALKLWVNSVIPTLLPFFIATELLGYTNFVHLLGKLLDKFMKPIFNVPGISAFPFIMGIISGYPIGAKIVSDLKIQGKITNIEAERLIAYVNNSGPLFIIGTVGISLFNNSSIGILLFITHILAGLSVGLLFRWWKYKTTINTEQKKSHIFLHKKISLLNLGEVLSDSIISSINTIFLIGGYIVLFSIIISILENSGILNIFSNLLMPFLNTFLIPNSYANGIISGIIELTNGVYAISLISNNPISTNVVICAFLIGFGGLSVSFQILSIISKAKISIRPYIIGKLLQAILAAVYTYLIIQFYT